MTGTSTYWPRGLTTGWDLRGATAAFWPGEEDKYHLYLPTGARSALVGTRQYIDGGYLVATAPDFGEVIGDQPRQIVAGQWTDDTNAGASHYLGGLYNWETTAGLDPTSFQVVNGLLVLNYTDMNWRNETVIGDPTVRGFLNYLPIGQSGVLVNFGGERFTNRHNSV
ncbi:hypothetical protein K440DRAFT_642499 [Wilcoxina mikolae CBS 423.85]|nr:hypothetical protein K440DRAFT_642499 [Wilcoxina mikolae CBS 423.85]